MMRWLYQHPMMFLDEWAVLKQAVCHSVERVLSSKNRAYDYCLYLETCRVHANPDEKSFFYQTLVELGIYPPCLPRDIQPIPYSYGEG